MLSSIKIKSRSVILKMAVSYALAAFFSVSIVDAYAEPAKDSVGGKQMSSEAIEQALKAHTDALMSLSGVVGTGQGLCDNQPCIKVFVIKKTPTLEKEIRHILEDCPTSIEETGRIRARPNPPKQ